jgi:hypothetical protein
MPTLRKKKDKELYYALTSISGKVVTFQLSRHGLQRLLGVGLSDGDQFERGVLLDLYNSGDAFTLGSTRIAPPEDFGGRQLELDFSDDPTPESAFPSCSRCTSAQDLYLVTPRDEQPHDGYVLCADCRLTQTGPPDVSMPLHMVTRTILAGLHEAGLLTNPDIQVTQYRTSLEINFENKWEELRKRKSRRQEPLFPHADRSQRPLIE